MTAAPLLYAPHEKNGRFFCPWERFPVRFTDLLKWKLAGKGPYDRKAPLEVPVLSNDGNYLRDKGQPPSVTWVGHCTFAVQDGGDIFLTDPHWGPRALVPARLTPPGIPLSTVPDDAFVVLSHNHYDHLDAWTIRRLDPSIPWYAPLGLGTWLRRKGPRQVTELDWWQSAHHGRWTLTCLPAQHWSNRIGMARNSTLWCSWLLENGLRRYYFAGDSGYFAGFAEIGRRFGPIDIAFLPIGAYEPRWFMKYQHMDPRDAWQALQDLNARHLIAMHWGTFDLTDEPPDLAPRVLAQVVREAEAEVDRAHVLAIGERWLLETLC